MNDTATTNTYTADTLFPYTTLFRSLAAASCIDSWQQIRTLHTIERPGLLHAGNRHAQIPIIVQRLVDNPSQSGIGEEILPADLGEWRLGRLAEQIGRASCRERVCQYV